MRPCRLLMRSPTVIVNRQILPRNVQQAFPLWVPFVFLTSWWLAVPCQAVDQAHKRLAQNYCVDCHGRSDPEGNLDLESLLDQPIENHSDTWERVVRKLSTRQMPPRASKRPTPDEYGAALGQLTSALDAAAIVTPQPGILTAFKRLNRTEYQNAIRDLLDLEIDSTEYLPADESSDGFDHTRMRHLSPTLITRYLTAAQRISRLAVGLPAASPSGRTYRIRPDVTQEKHVLGLPLGTRGGGIFLHHFQQSGTYEVQIRLTRDRNDEVEGLKGKHELVILVDKTSVASLLVEPPASGTLADFDDGLLSTRIHVTSGPHRLGATFLRKSGSIEETIRKPLNVHYNLHRHPRLSPAIYELSITGPYPAHSQQPEHRSEAKTPSQKRIFIARPNEQLAAKAAAVRVLKPLARRAYRRTVTDDDLTRLLRFFDTANSENGFESGIQSALAAILTSPHFLFKIEADSSTEDSSTADSSTVGPNTPYAINNFELASRLSFFLWSSLPDDELLDLAEQGVLHRPEVLSAQVKRMFADSRTVNLATNFASQWLQLRNLEAIAPDSRKFPDFDENLRQAMRRETELHIEQLIAKDRSVLDLLQSNHTFLNERLAKHYEIKGVSGSRYRRVDLASEDRRGGLLRQASILTITSYATRTSPVVRGNWVLENILGAPTPPPPDDVPALDEQSSVAEFSSVREQLMQHRNDPACASCHDLMDPIGFALENYDAVGRWRERDQEDPILTKGQLPTGKQFDNIEDLEDALLEQPELFVTAFVEKLLTFALGRGTEFHDAPAIRKIVRDAKEDHFRLSGIILGVVHSVPFQLRMSP